MSCFTDLEVIVANVVVCTFAAVPTYYVSTRPVESLMRTFVKSSVTRVSGGFWMLVMRKVIGLLAIVDPPEKVNLTVIEVVPTFVHATAVKLPEGEQEKDVGSVTYFGNVNDKMSPVM